MDQLSDENLTAMAIQTGLLPPGSPLTPELRDYSCNLIMLVCHLDAQAPSNPSRGDAGLLQALAERKANGRACQGRSGKPDGAWSS